MAKPANILFGNGNEPERNDDNVCGRDEPKDSAFGKWRWWWGQFRVAHIDSKCGDRNKQRKSGDIDSLDGISLYSAAFEDSDKHNDDDGSHAVVSHHQRAANRQWWVPSGNEHAI